MSSSDFFNDEVLDQDNRPGKSTDVEQIQEIHQFRLILVSNSIETIPFGSASLASAVFRRGFSNEFWENHSTLV